MKKDPTDAEDISPYTDTTVSIRVSQNGHGNYVGIGKIFLDKADENTLCVSFARRVAIQPRSVTDGHTDTAHFEPEAVQGTYAVNQVERFNTFHIIGKTDDELCLRSRKATIKIYFHPSLTGKVIESMVARQESTK